MTVPIIFIALFLALVLMAFQHRHISTLLEGGIFSEASINKMTHDIEKNWSNYEEEIFSITVDKASRAKTHGILETWIIASVNLSTVNSVDSEDSKDRITVAYTATDKSGSKIVFYPFGEFLDIATDCCGSKTCEQCKTSWPGYLFDCNTYSVGKSETSSEYQMHELC